MDTEYMPPSMLPSRGLSEPPGKPIHSMIYVIIQVMLEKNCTLSIKTETAHMKYELSHKSKRYN